MDRKAKRNRTGHAWFRLGSWGGAFFAGGLVLSGLLVEIPMVEVKRHRLSDIPITAMTMLKDGSLPGSKVYRQNTPTSRSKPRRSERIEDLRWERVRVPSEQLAESIGGYSRGCVAGAVALKMDGKNYRVMRPSRQRNYGHLVLIEFIKDLAGAMKEHKLGPLAVGDLGQARGGPAPSGHRSHQSGLDVDLWFVAPSALQNGKKINARALASMGAEDIVDEASGQPKENFERSIDSMLRRSAEDERVDRIFVHPIVKRTLCERATSAATSTGWLQKIRPWWGHRSHFHVRLRCPEDSSNCESQSALPAGDGCDALSWWFDPKAQEDRSSGQKKYREGIGKAPDMPDACRDVFRAPAKRRKKGKRAK